MSGKAKKAQAGLSALDLLKSRVPTAADRLQRVDRAIKVLILAIRREDQDYQDISIDPSEAEVLLEMLKEADDDIFWLRKLSPSLLKTAAPDDDDTAAIAADGGAR
jgi:hypothetical protein